MTLIIAHRGASTDEVENSLAAFEAAIRQGADGIELDVHVSRDGIPIVHHDPVVGDAAIAEHPLADLRDCRLANGEPLPTLERALGVIGSACDVFIELKALPAVHVGAFLDVVRGGPDPSRYQVHSFDHRLVAGLRRHDADLRVGALSCSYPIDPVSQLERAGATVLWQEQTLLDEELVTAVHDAGAEVIAWTVDEPQRLRSLTAFGVDAICTNQPRRAREALA